MNPTPIKDRPRWKTVIKRTDGFVFGSTTPEADSELFVPMAANTKYIIRLKAFVSAGEISSTYDFKYQFVGPASPTDAWLWYYDVAPAGTTPNYYAIATGSTSEIPILGSTTDPSIIHADIVWHNGANAGNFEFRWCQNSGGALGLTVVYAGSYLEYAIL